MYFQICTPPPISKNASRSTIFELDPTPGFDYFSGKVHEIIEKQGKDTHYIFDNLSALVSEWATDELLANFYQVTCPYIFELNDLAFFGLIRGRHSHSTIARIRDTTQILLDVYHIDGNTYIHPLKVWGRYSPQMFLPHLVSQTNGNPFLKAAMRLQYWRHQVNTWPIPCLIPPHHGIAFIANWRNIKKTRWIYRSVNSEITVLKRELSRMMLGNHEKLNRLSDRYLIADDLFNIRERLIGSGQIGGKAVGMLLARRILQEEPGKIDFSGILEEHDSFYIGSDVFFTFLVNNNLFRLRLQLSKKTAIIQRGI